MLSYFSRSSRLLQAPLFVRSDNVRFLFIPPQEIHDGVAGDGKVDRWKISLTFLSAPADDCDFRLAENNQAGISRSHFCLDISLRNRPRITSLFRNQIHVHCSG